MKALGYSLLRSPKVVDQRCETCYFVQTLSFRLFFWRKRRKRKSLAKRKTPKIRRFRRLRTTRRATRPPPRKLFEKSLTKTFIKLAKLVRFVYSLGCSLLRRTQSNRFFFLSFRAVGKTNGSFFLKKIVFFEKKFENVAQPGTTWHYLAHFFLL